jgi:hypothetical protein
MSGSVAAVFSATRELVKLRGWPGALKRMPGT